jgi:LysM repeat protein
MAFPRRLVRGALVIVTLGTATLLAPSSLAKLEERAAAGSKTGETPQPAVVHRVSKGQTLSEIALRYHVTVRALERANGLRSGGVIRAGQRLQVPTRPQPKAEAKAAEKLQAKAVSTADPKPEGPKPSVPKSAVKTDKAQPAKPGPTKLGKAAAVLSVTAPARALVNTDSWKLYRKPAERPGYVVLHGTAGAYSGFAIIKGDRLSPKAYLEIRRVLASWRTGKQVDISERLIRLLVKTSDTFGGRPIRIVGGYREHSYFEDSKHPLGHAVDFSVDGVPNTALRDFLRTQPRVGVGFYPNSSFVHLDVRNRSAYWIDRAGPGQPPQNRPAPVTPPPAPVNPTPPLNVTRAPVVPLEPLSVAALSPEL